MRARAAPDLPSSSGPPIDRKSRCLPSLLSSTLVSVLDVLVHALRPDLGAENVAHRVRGNALCGTGTGGLGRRVGYERSHRAVAHAADANTALPVAVRRRDRARFGIGHVDDVILVDE